MTTTDVPHTGQDPHPEPGTLERFARSFVAGAGDVGAAVAGASQFVTGGEEPGGVMNTIRQHSEDLQSIAPETKPIEGWSDLLDFDYWINAAPRTALFSLALIPLAYMGAGAGAAAGTIAGISKTRPLWSFILKSLGGATASRVGESLLEAGDTFNQATSQGMGQDQASDAARSVFRNNMKLILLDAVQMGAVLAPGVMRAAKIGAGTIRGLTAAGAVAGMASEGYEEVLQQSYQGEALGFTPTRGQDIEAFALGTFTGGIFQGAGMIADHIAVRAERRADATTAAEIKRIRETQGGIAAITWLENNGQAKLGEQATLEFKNTMDQLVAAKQAAALSGTVDDATARVYAEATIKAVAQQANPTADDLSRQEHAQQFIEGKINKDQWLAAYTPLGNAVQSALTGKPATAAAAPKAAAATTTAVPGTPATTVTTAPGAVSEQQKAEAWEGIKKEMQVYVAETGKGLYGKNPAAMESFTRLMDMAAQGAIPIEQVMALGMMHDKMGKYGIGNDIARNVHLLQAQQAAIGGEENVNYAMIDFKNLSALNDAFPSEDLVDSLVMPHVAEIMMKHVNAARKEGRQVFLDRFGGDEYSLITIGVDTKETQGIVHAMEAEFVDFAKNYTPPEGLTEKSTTLKKGMLTAMRSIKKPDKLRFVTPGVEAGVVNLNESFREQLLGRGAEEHEASEEKKRVAAEKEGKPYIKEGFMRSHVKATAKARLDVVKALAYERGIGVEDIAAEYIRTGQLSADLPLEETFALFRDRGVTADLKEELEKRLVPLRAKAKDKGLRNRIYEYYKEDSPLARQVEKKLVDDAPTMPQRPDINPSTVQAFVDAIRIINARQGAGWERMPETKVSEVMKEYLLAGGFSIDEFITKGFVDMYGMTVGNVADLAVAAQILRDPRFEVLNYIWVKDGKIIYNQMVSSRIANTTAWHADVSDREALNKLVEQSKMLNADGVYVVHNHPGAFETPLPSSNDILFDSYLRDNINNLMGKDFYKGHVVVDSGAYASLKTGIKYSWAKDNLYKGEVAPHGTYTLNPIKTDDRIYSAIVPSQYYLQKLTSAAECVGIAKTFQKSGSMVVFFLDSRKRITAIERERVEAALDIGGLEFDLVKQPNGKFADYLHDHAVQHGAGTIFLAIHASDMAGPNKQQIMQNMKLLVNSRIVADVLIYDDTGMAIASRKVTPLARPSESTFFGVTAKKRALVLRMVGLDPKIRESFVEKKLEADQLAAEIDAKYTSNDFAGIEDMEQRYERLVTEMDDMLAEANEETELADQDPDVAIEEVSNSPTMMEELALAYAERNRFNDTEFEFEKEKIDRIRGILTMGDRHFGMDLVNAVIGKYGSYDDYVRFVNNLSDQQIMDIAEDSYSYYYDLWRRRKGEKLSVGKSLHELVSAPLPAMPDGPVFTDVDLGDPGKAKTTRGRVHGYKWAIVEADKLVVSNKQDMSENPQYPKEYQNRNRNSAIDAVQIANIKANLDPDLFGLSNSVLAAFGAPIALPNGVIIGGNARTMGILGAYAENLASADRYKKWLKKDAKTFGVDPKHVAGLQNPVLVRVADEFKDKQDGIVFAIQANESGTSAYSAIEEAFNDAAMMSARLMSRFEPDENGNIDTAKNAEFISEFTKLLNPLDMKNVVVNGRLTVQGHERIQRAVLAKAYGDSETILQLSVAGDREQVLKRLSTALIKASGYVAVLHDYVETTPRQLSESAKALDISKDIVTTAKLMGDLKRSARSGTDYVEMYLNSPEFGGYALTQFQMELLQMFNQNKNSATAIAEFLQKYAKEAKAELDRQESFAEGFFAATDKTEKTKTWRDVWNDTVKSIEGKLPSEIYRDLSQETRPDKAAVQQEIPVTTPTTVAEDLVDAAGKPLPPIMKWIGKKKLGTLIVRRGTDGNIEILQRQAEAEADSEWKATKQWIVAEGEVFEELMRQLESKTGKAFTPGKGETTEEEVVRLREEAKYMQSIFHQAFNKGKLFGQAAGRLAGQKQAYFAGRKEGYEKAAAALKDYRKKEIDAARATNQKLVDYRKKQIEHLKGNVAFYKELLAARKASDRARQAIIDYAHKVMPEASHLAEAHGEAAFAMKTFNSKVLNLVRNQMIGPERLTEVLDYINTWADSVEKIVAMARLDAVIKSIPHKGRTFKMPANLRNDLAFILNTVRDLVVDEKMGRILNDLSIWAHDNDVHLEQESHNQLVELARKPSNQMTAEDINAIVDRAKEILKSSREQRKMWLAGKEQDRQEMVDAATGLVDKGHPLKFDLDKLGPAGPKTSQALKVWLANLNLETMAERLGGIGDMESVIYQVLYEEINRGTGDQLDILHGAEEAMQAAARGAGVDSTWSEVLSRKGKDTQRFAVTIASRPEPLMLTKGERISLIMHSRAADNLNILMEQGFLFSTNKFAGEPVKLSIEDIEAIVASATPAELKIADSMRLTIDEIGKLINVVSRELKGFDVAIEENYWTLKRKYFKGDTVIPGFIHQTLTGMGILKPRTGGTSPLFLEDAFSQWYDHVQKTSAFVGLAIPLRNARLLVTDHKFRTAIVSHMGPEFLQILETHLTNIEDGSVKKDVFEGFIEEKIRHIDVAILGMNPWVVMKQPVSVLMAGVDIDYKYLIPTFLQVFTAEDLKYLQQYAPELRERRMGGWAKEPQEIANAGKLREIALGKKDWRSRAMTGIQMADFFAVKRVWLAAKNEIEAKGAVTKGSVDYWRQVAKRAGDIVRRTQSTSNVKDRSVHLQSKNLFTRLLTKYQSQQSKNFNILYREFHRWLSGPKDAITTAKYGNALVLAALLNPLFMIFIDLLRRRMYGKDELMVVDPETGQKVVNYSEIGRRLLRENMSTVAFAGSLYDMVDSMLHPNRPRREDVATSTVMDFMQGMMSMYNGLPGMFSEDPETLKKAQEDLLRATQNLMAGTGKLTGVPAYNIYKMGEMAWLNLNDTEVNNDHSEIRGLYAIYNRGAGRVQGPITKRDYMDVAAAAEAGDARAFEAALAEYLATTQERGVTTTDAMKALRGAVLRRRPVPTDNPDRVAAFYSWLQQNSPQAVPIARAQQQQFMQIVNSYIPRAGRVRWPRRIGKGVRRRRSIGINRRRGYRLYSRKMSRSMAPKKRRIRNAKNRR